MPPAGSLMKTRLCTPSATMSPTDAAAITLPESAAAGSAAPPMSTTELKSTAIVVAVEILRVRKMVSTPTVKGPPGTWR